MSTNMFIFIKKATSFDICRDGGTLVAQYEGLRGYKYCLDFPADHKPVLKNGQFVDLELAGYKDPILTIYKPSIYKSPVTGIKIPETIERKKTVTWKYARKVLNKLKPLVEKSNLDREYIFQKMVKIANHNGSIKNS